jgi:hypothetical protein
MGGERENAATDAMHADQTFSDKSTTNQPILRPFSSGRQHPALTEAGAERRPLARLVVVKIPAWPV